MLKQKLTEAPLLILPDFDKPFEVIADASQFAIGAILVQEGRSVAFESRRLTPAEEHITKERELLAVIHALTVWRCYLADSKFTICSDHIPLQYWRTKPSLSHKEVRWSQFIERFDYTWEYRQGKLNAADPLSRAKHASISGSGVGSLTGSSVPTETVLEHLAAIAPLLPQASLLTVLENLAVATRNSGREQEGNVVPRKGTHPPAAPRLDSTGHLPTEDH